MPYDPFGPAPPPVKPKKKKAVARYQYSPGVAGGPVYPVEPGDLGFVATPQSPDYTSLIENDPAYQLLKAQLAAAGVSDTASAQAAMKRALIQFGQIPDDSSFAGMFGPSEPGGGLNWVDDQTRQLAAQNTQAGLSTVARLQKAHEKAVGGLRDNLAARGITRSGAMGVGLNQEQQAFTSANYDATQKLLDYAAGVQQGLAAAEQDRQSRQLQAMQEAATRQASLPWNAPSQTKPAVPSGPTSITLPAPPPGKPKKKKALPGVYNVGGAAYGRGI